MVYHFALLPSMIATKTGIFRMGLPQREGERLWSLAGRASQLLHKIQRLVSKPYPEDNVGFQALIEDWRTISHPSTTLDKLLQSPAQTSHTGWQMAFDSGLT